MFDENDTLVLELAGTLRAQSILCASAESCTGGLIGAMLTAVPGSSEWYAGGVISYSNSVKKELLGVDAYSLEVSGAVSEAVVRAMALGVCKVTGAAAGISVSGVAGPGGGSPEKPVGTVWIGWSLFGAARAERFLFSGSRNEVRRQAARAAINGMLAWMKEQTA